MAGRNEWGVPPMVISAPPFASPNDAAITIGPLFGAQMPVCMQSFYEAAIFFRISNSGSGQVPMRFMAIRRSSGIPRFDSGFLLWDFTDTGTQNCGYVTTESWTAENLGPDPLDPSVDLIKLRAAQGLIGGAGAAFPAEVDGDFTFLWKTVQIEEGDFRIGDRDPFGNMVRVSQGRGRQFRMADPAPTGSIGTSFTEVLAKTEDMVWRNGRGYSLNINGGGLSTSSSANVGQFVLNDVRGGNEDNIYDFGWFGPEFGTHPKNVTAVGYVVNTSGADIVSSALKLYLRASADTVAWLVNPGTKSSPRSLTVFDVGAASDLENAVTL